MRETTQLIIGAGPYGLAVAAQARRRGIASTVLGEPMGFWKHHMPAGMLLRSGIAWHLDPAGEHTLAAFLAERGIDPATAEPIPVALFIDYAQWFQSRAGIAVEPAVVTALHQRNGRFEAALEGGDAIAAAHVVAAPGFRPFANAPAELVAMVPPGRWSHSVDLVDFATLRGRRCLIVGGRQSAYESAALIGEQGAEVHVVHRHDTPRFAASDWSWVDGLIEATVQTRGWFRRLPREERESIAQRFWAEGRLKLEPWLGPRLRAARVTSWPNARIAGCREVAGGLDVALDNGAALRVDHVVLATGYKVDVAKVGYLQPLLPRLEVADGFAVLDEDFQTTAPGLFLPGLTATRDFGPFFGFVRGCPAAAKIIVERIATS